MRVARYCCTYTGESAARSRLLPEVLRQLGYDIGTPRAGGKLRVKAPGDNAWTEAPQILDDLAAIAALTPQPFELVGYYADPLTKRRVGWAAMVKDCRPYQHGLRPAATLAAALVIYTDVMRRLGLMVLREEGRAVITPIT